LSGDFGVDASLSGNRAFANQPSLWSSIGKLLRLRFKVFLSGFLRASLRRKIGTALLALVVSSVAVVAFVLSWLLLGFLRSPSLVEILSEYNLGSAALFIESIPVIILTGAFLGILLTSFGILLQALYLADDMEFLLSAPIPARAVFMAKLLEAILPNFSLIALLGLPVLFGLGASGGYNFLYYPLVVVAMGMLALAAAGVSGLLVMGIVRIIPARRVAEVLGFIGAILSLTCSQFNGIGRFLFPQTQVSTGVQLSFSVLSRFNTPWSPLAWAGRGLVDLGEGRWISGIGFLALTLGMAGALFFVALTTAEHLYYSGWAGMQIGARKKRPERSVAAAPAQANASATHPAIAIPPAVRAILRKDLILLRRDLRNLSRLVTPLILGIIYGFILLRSGGIPASVNREVPAWLMPILKTGMVYVNVGISIFVSWSLLSRIALMSFSMEGKNYWMLKSAPVRAGQLIAAKYALAYLPAVLIGWMYYLVISIVQASSISGLAYGFFVVTLALAGAVGINLAMGITGANLTWDDPRRMNSGTTGCTSFVASIGYLIISLSLFFAPPIILSLFGVPALVGQGIGLTLGGVVSFACAVFPLYLVAGKVDRIGEA
jgi:ABC-2 type transport system permease protein